MIVVPLAIAHDTGAVAVELQVQDPFPEVRLARLSNVAEPDLRLLEVAAAFHELGQIRTYFALPAG